MASGRCLALALLVLIILWPRWPKVVALTKGSGGLCRALRAVVLHLLGCCILGAVWVPWDTLVQEMLLLLAPREVPSAVAACEASWHQENPRAQ